MKREMTLPGWHPTVQQELLLRAALAEGDETLRSWQQWKKCADLAQLDGGTVRLLPLLYHNLKLHGVEDLIMERFKQEYLHTWRNNEILFYEIATLLPLFQDVGIETILLKGITLALHFYRDAGLRPMSDVDLLVRLEKASLAIKLLHQAGWKSAYKSPEALIPYRHAIEFSNEQGHKVDLHWKVMWGGAQEVSDHDFWESAIPIELNNVATNVLNPTDQLLHVCVHGVAWNDLPPLRWVADATVIIRRAKPEINWNRLIEQIQRRRLMLPMKDALGYLEYFLGAAVPSEVLITIHKIPASPLERSLHRLRASPNRELRKFPTLYYWFNVWRLSGKSQFQQCLDFLRYLQCFWGVQHLWQTPFYIVLESARSVKRIFSRFAVKEIRSP